MRRIAPLVAVAAITLSIGACEDTYYAGGYGGGVGLGYVNGYYDDFYGPFYDGYWGPDRAFYYRSGPNAAFIRDSGAHFRRGSANGFHSFHAPMGHPGGGGAHGGPHGGGGPGRP